MPALIASSLPVIAQAVEQQLLAYTSTLTTAPVVGDISNIYWVLPGEEPPPGRTGQRDVLLVFLPDFAENVEGDGIFARLRSGMDLNLRSTLALDRAGTKKDFQIAHRLLVNGLLDAMFDFFPVDGSGNALTIYGFVLDTNTSPRKSDAALTWGETISTYRFDYIPNIARTPVR